MKREWCHGSDQGQRCHQDRPQTDARGGQRGRANVVTTFAQLIGELNQENAVVDDNSDHHQCPHQRLDIERRIGQKENQQYSR